MPKTTAVECRDCGVGMQTANDGALRCPYCNSWAFRDAISDGAIYAAASQPTARPEPTHIQINPLAGSYWGWVVWFGGDANPLDREGSASSLDEALACVKEVTHAN